MTSHFLKTKQNKNKNPSKLGGIDYEEWRASESIIHCSSSGAQKHFSIALA